MQKSQTADLNLTTNTHTHTGTNSVRPDTLTEHTHTCTIFHLYSVKVYTMCFVLRVARELFAAITVYLNLLACRIVQRKTATEGVVLFFTSAF